MKETVLITGANSFIAKHLTPLLNDRFKLKFLTRTPKAENEYAWDVSSKHIAIGALDDVNYIVHLAGAKINDGKPLTEERKATIRESRIGAAQLLREKLQANGQRLKAFVSASAIGYYGFTESTLEIDESGKKGFGFNADLCGDWEHAADEFKEFDVADHVSKIRVSLVLGNEGGIFPMYRQQVNAHPEIALQAPQGALPWNHVEDMAGIFAFALTAQLDGVYNSVAPVAAASQDVFKAIVNETTAQKLAINTFQGQHLVAHKIVDAGYSFKYPSIEIAVAQLMRSEEA